ncbi:MAG: hypothetical protein R3F31_08335 [Verrucomicrobiales bacterium]
MNTITQPSAKGNAPDQGVFVGLCFLVALLSPLAVVRAGETGIAAYQEVSRLLDDDTRQKFALEYEIHEQGTARVLGADFAPLSGATVGPYVFEAKRKGGLSWTHRLTVTTEWALVDRNGREIEPGIRPGEEVKIRELVKSAEILPLTGATCAVSVEDAVKRAQSVLAEIKSLSLVDLPLSWKGGTMIRSQSGEIVRKVVFKSSAPAFYVETQTDDKGVPVFLFFKWTKLLREMPAKSWSAGFTCMKGRCGAVWKKWRPFPPEVTARPCSRPRPTRRSPSIPRLPGGFRRPPSHCCRRLTWRAWPRKFFAPRGVFKSLPFPWISRPGLPWR